MADAHITIIDALRKRPAMYLGDTGALGLVRLIESVLELPRRPQRIVLRHSSRARYVIEAEGTGISLDSGGTDSRPYLEQLMNKIHLPVDAPPSVSCIEYLVDDSNTVHFAESQSASPALAFAYAFSEQLIVTSTCRGKRGRIRCARGVVVEPLVIEKVNLVDGLQIDMIVDPTILSVVVVGTTALATVARDVANRRRLPVELIDSEEGREVRFLADGNAG
jgi:hypothetical protein